MAWFLPRNDRSRMPEGLYRFVWQWTGRQQLLLVLLSAIVFPLTLVPLELQRRIVNEAIERGELRSLLLLSGVYATVVIVQALLKFVLNVRRGRVAESVMREVRRRVLEETPGQADGSNRQDSGSEDEAAEGTAVVMLSTEVEPVGNFTGDAVSVPVVEAGTLLVALAYMIAIEPLLALVGLGLFVPQAVLVPYVQQAINRRARYRIGVLRDIGDTIAERGIENLRDGERAGVRGQIDEIFGTRMAIFRLKFGLKGILNLIDHFSVIGILLVGGWMTINGATQVGTVVAFLSGLQRLRNPWRDLVAFYRAAADARVKYGLMRRALQS